MNVFKGILCATVLVNMISPAFAGEDTVKGTDLLAKERFQVRVRAIGVVPAEKSSVSISGAQQSEEVKVSNEVVPEVDLTYFITDHIAAEAIAATAHHKMDFNGSDLGEAWILPPTVTLQYHFTPDKAFSPYVGAGVNYSVFYGEKAADGFNDFDIQSGFGPAAQVGFDYWVNKNWGINMDVKKIWLNVDATLNNGAVKADIDLDPWVVGAGVSYRF